MNNDNNLNDELVEEINISNNNIISENSELSSEEKKKVNSKIINLLYNFFLDEQENFLKVIMTQMKRKLEFIEKTNWMFQSNFDIHFLESIDPKLIEDNQNYIYIDPQ